MRWKKIENRIVYIHIKKNTSTPLRSEIISFLRATTDTKNRFRAKMAEKEKRTDRANGRSFGLRTFVSLRRWTFCFWPEAGAEKKSNRGRQKVKPGKNRPQSALGRSFSDFPRRSRRRKKSGKTSCRRHEWTTRFCARMNRCRLNVCLD